LWGPYARSAFGSFSGNRHQLASCIDDKSCPPQAWHSSASTKVWAPTWLGGVGSVPIFSHGKLDMFKFFLDL
jgi:hypothetical protein